MMSAIENNGALNLIVDSEAQLAQLVTIGLVTQAAAPTTNLSTFTFASQHFKRNFTALAYTANLGNAALTEDVGDIWADQAALILRVITENCIPLEN